MMHLVTDCPEGCVTHSQSLMCLLALFAAVLKLQLSLNPDCRNKKKTFNFTLLPSCPTNFNVEGKIILHLDFLTCNQEQILVPTSCLDAVIISSYVFPSMFPALLSSQCSQCPSIF